MIPVIEQLQAKYKDNDKVAVLAVNLDDPDTPAKTIEDAAKQLKLTRAAPPRQRHRGPRAAEDHRAADHAFHRRQGRAPGLHRRRQSGRPPPRHPQAGKAAGRRGPCQAGARRSSRQQTRR